MPSEPRPQRRPRSSRRRPSTPALAGLGLLIGLGLSAVSLLLVDSGGGELRYSGVPRVELPLPPASPGAAPARPSAEAAVTLAGAEPVPVERVGAPAAQPPPAGVRGPPVEPDPHLSEPGPYGPLPRVGPDARAPHRVYARGSDPAAGDGRPRVALLVTGLGLWSAATEVALNLPPAVSLAFSPYTPDLPGLLKRARGAGHEVLLVLPMEPTGYPG
ncbi:MAG TPA: divergent polysaccharide deacetylase family protein, partial [Geminicoccaceae bacterium]|nr:divergent polysaccharide deacetylase family protein [Geminicoccaceae bacterium]